MVPSLLYHTINLTLYPTNDDDENLLVIRFNESVRISDVQIIPEGVKGLNGIGTTYPLKWSGRLLLNVNPSNPVNALASTIINVIPSENPLNYPINMPIGVTTRMLMLYSPAKKLTLSVYGYYGEQLDSENNVEEVDSRIIIDNISDGISNDNGKEDEKENFEWLYRWSGESPSSLLDLLDDSTPKQISNRAMECLLLLDQVQPIFNLIIQHKSALEYIMKQPLSLREKILSNSQYALHPSISPYLPQEYPLKCLVQASSSEKHTAAWKNLSLGLGPLLVLQDVEEDELLNIEKGEEKSNLIKLIELSENHIKFNSNDDDNSRRCMERILDILNRPFESTILNDYLSSKLPRLIVNAIVVGGSKRELQIPFSHSQEVVRNLVLLRSEIINGQSTRSICDEMARKYVDQLNEDDPLRKVFGTSGYLVPDLTQRDNIQLEKDEDKRRFERLSNSINQINYNDSNNLNKSYYSSSSLIHSATQSEILSIISPELVNSLSTSKEPSFGIKSIIQLNDYLDSQNTKNFAGKIYTLHEFRKDRNQLQGQNQNDISSSSNLGLNINYTPSGNVGMGMGMGMGMGNMGGLGINSSSNFGGRAASRHVDSWTK
ncbi:uncharacterized protein L201_003874 [Kwoniella dendrophila CBS 6074]|uniref:CCR4-NOT transcription complex subunit 11 n=1 Tax=Kwoniella dendrophila CBS 6074 TaxID=1295534 RepID=A0AAX4JVV3_9TREE